MAAVCRSGRSERADDTEMKRVWVAGSAATVTASMGAGASYQLPRQPCASPSEVEEKATTSQHLLLQSMARVFPTPAFASKGSALDPEPVRQRLGVFAWVSGHARPRGTTAGAPGLSHTDLSQGDISMQCTAGSRARTGVAHSKTTGMSTDTVHWLPTSLQHRLNALHMSSAYPCAYNVSRPEHGACL